MDAKRDWVQLLGNATTKFLVASSRSHVSTLIDEFLSACN
jgi:hypothetical protein